VSAFLPRPATGSPHQPDHPRLCSRPRSLSEQRARWEVRAAQWRAREIAESVFGRVASTALIGLRSDGPLRGLLHLEVPFRDLDAHREREALFLDAAAADPILERIRLVYVFGPEIA
jgi:hypothetical protein